MPRILFIPRIQQCAVRPAVCIVCGEQAMTINFDCDLLGRVCPVCAKAGGVSQIELQKAGIVPPDTNLIKANP